MKAFEVARIIEQFAPLDTAAEWDNTGFCIGSPQTEVRAVLVGFDCTPALVREAVERGANMIVTHHPLIFRGIKKISPDNFLGEIITLAVKNDIVVYSAHTNADKAEGGVNTLMAERLGLQDCSVLSSDGFGLVGHLPRPMAEEDFIAFVKKQFSLKVVRTSRLTGKPVGKVALCSGSGSSLIGDALASGADAYICGDVSYHQFFTEKGFLLLDIGHFESEIDIVGKLISVLEEKNSTFAVLRTNEDYNPIHYF
jgi:dinuclear metal center YbgI/SA1388 family protein